MNKTHLPLVAIIGRTNVGKSTLFNKFIEQRKALISRTPGTTRDLNYGICEWLGKKFEVVDTGGIFEIKIKKNSSRPFQGGDSGGVNSIEYQTEKKARQVLDKADLILFMVDSKDGILKDDRLIAQLIRKNEALPRSKTTPHILVANKIDKTKSITPAEFKKLGLGDALGVAAASGVGVGDLCDEIIKKIDFTKGHGILRSAQDDIPDSISVCIVGKPNVGKSSLLNQILGEEKVIVSPVPHTTREPQDTVLEYKKNTIELIDTAGIRRKSKVKAKSLESAGIAMSIKALKKSDIALFVLDISQSLTAQDAQLAGLIISSGVSVIFVANKYDLLTQKQKNTKTQKHNNIIDDEDKRHLTKELTEYIYKYFPFLTWAPIIFTSGLTGRNTQKILPLILEIKAARQQQVDEKELNEFLKYLFTKMPPPRQAKTVVRVTLGKPPKKSRAYISKIIQVDAPRPIFEMNVTNISKIPESYMRFLENNIRDKYKFTGTPIKIRVKRDKK